MSQTTISAGGQARYNAGDLADSGLNDNLSGINEETVEMPWGYGLRDGASERGYKLATGFSGAVPVTGVLARSIASQRITFPNGQNNGGNFGGSGLLQYADLRVVHKGRVVVPVEGAVTLGQGAWCRGVATGTLTRGSWLGAARGAAGPLSASYHVDCSKQAVFRSASFTAADGTTTVAILEVDFTNSPY
jgi:hypothetical protein